MGSRARRRSRSGWPLCPRPRRSRRPRQSGLGVAYMTSGAVLAGETGPSLPAVKQSEAAPTPAAPKDLGEAYVTTGVMLDPDPAPAPAPGPSLPPLAVLKAAVEKACGP